MKKLSLLCVLSLVAFGCGDDDSSTTTRDGGSTTDSGTTTDGGSEGFNFRTDAPSAYTQVDRSGMPAVSTALVSAPMKNAYNAGSPANDVMGTDCANDVTTCTWAGEFVNSLTGIHQLTPNGGVPLDDQLESLGLTACGNSNEDGGSALACVAQEVATDLMVARLVVPDVITIDTGADAGFPNGRRLSDPVMDITLAILLLDLSVDNQGAGTFLDLDPDMDGDQPLNPDANDIPFKTAFPYVADPHAPGGS